MSIDPRSISIQDYTYELPDSRIAQHPLEERDMSRLLVYRNGDIVGTVFRDLVSHLQKGSLVVFNNTRVVRARLLMQRATGGLVEIFCTDAADISRNFTLTLQTTHSVEVIAFVGNSRRWKEEEELVMEFPGGKLHARKIAPVAEQWKVQLSWTPEELTFADVLDAAGKIPLPPYMHRDEEQTDSDRYQTVFAETSGSVAAPTASLHFTDDMLTLLTAKEIASAIVTLHVGAGTFKPVKSDTMSGHDMHREQINVTRVALQQLIAHLDKGIIAAGTTALRTIESLYWFGRRLVLNPGEYRSELFVGQWEPYEGGPEVPTKVALQSLLDWMIENNHALVSGFTQILIAPGYKFRLANGLITNFHQPQSTLLLLVAAFVGEDFRKIYDYALANNYRFLSYGDSSLLFRND